MLSSGMRSRLNGFAPNTEKLTLTFAFLSLVATLYFGLYPRPAVLPALDPDIAYIAGRPATRVLQVLASSDVTGALRFHLFYKDDPAVGLKQGDLLTFRSMTLAVTMIFPASQNGDMDPTHRVALCRVVSAGG